MAADTWLEVWKFVLNDRVPFTSASKPGDPLRTYWLRMPVGAKTLSVGNQRDQLCVWALVDPRQGETEDHWFEVFGTGHEIRPEPRVFLGTVMVRGGDLVWHVFERSIAPDGRRPFPVPGKPEDS